MPLPFLQDDQSGMYSAMTPISQNPTGMLTQSVTPGMTLPQALNAYRKRAADLYQRGEQLYNAEPDLSALQEFAKSRSDEGNSSLLNAMAAQFAGEQFQPVQAHLLKKATAAQEPLKLGSGLLTSEGKYIKDPFAAQDKRAEFLLQQAKNYEQMAATAQTAQEKASAEAMQRDIANQMRMMGLNLQAMQFQNSQLGQRDQQTSRLWQVEDRMRDDYERSVKDPTTVISSFNNLKATPVSAAGDISFVYQYMKMLDPGSVVREGEFATAQNAAGVPERIQNIYNKIVKGQRLSDRQRKEFLGTAESLADVATRRISAAQQQTEETARRRGVDVRNIFAPLKPSAKSDAGPAPAGVDANLWARMTPEERALWKK